jgi:lysozyme
MINPLVVDLSHWDPADNYSKVKASGIVGVIYKATDDTTYNDPTYVGQKQAAKAVGLKWGSYHFAHPGSVQGQIDNYLRFANPEKDELFCLDWETANDGTMAADEAQQWIIGVETALNRPGQCLIYSGNVAKEKLGSDVHEFFGKRRLWLAQYSSTPVVQASWSTYWLWQFTDGQVGPTPHSISGVGPCDINSYAGSASQLAVEWASGAVAPPTPVPPSEVATVTVTINSPPNVRVVVVNNTVGT